MRTVGERRSTIKTRRGDIDADIEAEIQTKIETAIATETDIGIVTYHQEGDTRRPTTIVRETEEKERETKETTGATITHAEVIAMREIHILR
jgi:hypothetical protein